MSIFDLLSQIHITMTSDKSSIKNALISVLAIADVGVLNGDGDGPRTPSRCLERSGKSFK